MPRTVEAVKFNDGTNEDVFALVVGSSHEDGNTLDLLTFDPSTGAPEMRHAVPKRDPSDYDESGGGDTWHD